MSHSLELLSRYNKFITRGIKDYYMSPLCHDRLLTILYYLVLYRKANVHILLTFLLLVFLFVNILSRDQTPIQNKRY